MSEFWVLSEFLWQFAISHFTLPNLTSMQSVSILLVSKSYLLWLGISDLT